jgi:TatA/E family protein of Tat protein translocase
MILVIALIIFGPRKLPELGKSLGKGLAQFRKASEDFKRQWEDEVEVEKHRLESAPAPGPAPTTGPAAEPAAATEPTYNHFEDYMAATDPPADDNAHSVAAPVTDPVTEPAAATVAREEHRAKEAKRDWM